METTSSPQSKKKRGARCGNTNALKHGRYSHQLQTEKNSPSSWRNSRGTP